MLPADYSESINELLNRPDLDFRPTAQGASKAVLVTSLNRYERKKNINLALASFAKYIAMPGAPKNSVLVVAGGYDERLRENVEHHLELVSLANKLQIIDKVVFLRSISNAQRVSLLKHTDILLYTPENEHFGIVPVEAMMLGAVVIACDSGGPLESVEHERTGFLLRPKANLWALKMLQIATNDFQVSFDTWLVQSEEDDKNGDAQLTRAQLVANARHRVARLFSERAFADRLEAMLKLLDEAPAGKPKAA